MPPLQFLLAVEATGRLQSVKAAAAELHVTPSAVSQQLRAVEEALGFALFERRARAIRLSGEGAEYLRELQHALSTLAGAGQRLRRRKPGRVLRISMADYLAYELILPRLSSFRARSPGVELALDVSARVVDFGACDSDRAACAVAARLARVPAQAGRARAGRAAHVRGLPRDLARRRAGLGVTFGIFPLITEWVKQGRLAVPLALRVPFAGKICFVHRAADARDPLYPELLGWLREQYQTLVPLAEGRILSRRA